jgi:hypothetical protein
MANPSSVPAHAPRAHEGKHYDNPSSKPLLGPLRKGDRDKTQRFIWPVFFGLILCVVTIGIVLGLASGQP